MVATGFNDIPVLKETDLAELDFWGNVSLNVSKVNAKWIDKNLGK